MARAMPATEFKEDPDALEHFLFDPEEGRQMFDEAAQEWVGMSGEEFIRRWEAGEFAEIPDDEAHRRYVDLVLMIPLACQES